MENTIEKASYAPIAIKLLQGAIYADDKGNVWNDLNKSATALKDYFAKIGLVLEISDADGFARLTQPEAGEHDSNPLPRLMRKQTLNYETSLLCVILREVLEEHDVKSEASKLFLTQKEIKERIELFYKEQSNKSKLWKDLSTPINNLVKIGVLKLANEDTVKDLNKYEVKRIVKALVSNEKLEEMRAELEKIKVQNN